MHIGKRLSTNSKMRTKVGSSYSAWEEILFSVPKGSVSEPLYLRFRFRTTLFNIFMWDLFVILENNYFTSYADDTTPYIVGNNNAEVLLELIKIAEIFFPGLIAIKCKQIMENATYFWVHQRRQISKFQEALLKARHARCIWGAFW